MKNSIFTKYRKKLVRQGIVSSCIYGLLAGACSAFIASFICWLCAYNLGWCIALALFAGVSALAAVILYFCKFRPTEKDVVRRVDKMGLEERAVTMAELLGDKSEIAKIQRADALEKLSGVEPRKEKSVFPTVAVGTVTLVSAGACLAAAIAMTLVTGLSGTVIPYPGGIGDDEREKFVSVSYLIEGGGEIDGDAEQLVLVGETADLVIAVPDDNWIFTGWSDGNKNIERQDGELKEDLIVTAYFEEIIEDENGEGDPNATPGDEGDEADDLPDSDQGSGMGDGSGDGGEGTGNGNTGDGSGTGSGGQEGEGNGNGQGDGAGGGWADGSQIIDGETDYRDVYQSYYDMAMEILQSGGELPPELKEFIETYYGSI